MILKLMMIVLGTVAVMILVREIYNQEPDLWELARELSVVNKTSSCPCNKLLLSSLGAAFTLQPKVMGVYTR